MFVTLPVIHFKANGEATEPRPVGVNTDLVALASALDGGRTRLTMTSNAPQRTLEIGAPLDETLALLNGLVRV
jgi:hypothetical protein